jgi:yeast amino acid transporter
MPIGEFTYEDEKWSENGGGSHYHDASIGATQGPGAGIDLMSNHQLERGLKSRHIQFLALGGAIGTG